MTTSLGSSSKKNPWLIYRDMSFLILWAVYWIWIKLELKTKHIYPLVVSFLENSPFLEAFPSWNEKVLVNFDVIYYFSTKWEKSFILYTLFLWALALYIISPESHIKVARKRKRSPSKEALDCYTKLFLSAP